MMISNYGRHSLFQAAIAVLILCGLTPHELSAQTAASREQCTCSLVGRHDPTGAQVLNAGVCRRTHIGEWCDIWLFATEGSQRHTSIIGQLRGVGSGQASIVDLLQSLFSEHMSPQASSDIHVSEAQDRNELEHRLQDAEGNLSQCVENFIAGHSTGLEGDGYNCLVGSESGWLSISISIGDGIISFLFAPER